MTRIASCKLPQDSLLYRYKKTAAYTDCYISEISGVLAFEDYVAAFYTTWLFKLERFLLSLIVSKPSTDAEARKLAVGSIHRFAAWEVEDRANNQLLLSDFQGQTRSWLMCIVDMKSKRTSLYFGSAVVATPDPQTGEARMGIVFRALLGFHKLYSRALLRAAVLKARAHKGRAG